MYDLSALLAWFGSGREFRGEKLEFGGDAVKRMITTIAIHGMNANASLLDDV